MREDLFCRFQELFYRWRGLWGVEQSKGGRIVPIHWNTFQKGMNVSPKLLQIYHQVTVIFAFIKNTGLKESNIHDIDLGMLLHQIVSQTIQMAIPTPVNQHKPLPI